MQLVRSLKFFVLLPLMLVVLVLGILEKKIPKFKNIFALLAIFPIFLLLVVLEHILGKDW